MPNKEQYISQNQNKHFKEVLSWTTLNRISLGQLNINSIRNRFDLLSDGITGNVNTFMISGIKTKGKYPSSQFFIAGHTSPFRLNQNRNGGGILLCILEDIPSKLIKIKDPW